MTALQAPPERQAIAARLQPASIAAAADRSSGFSLQAKLRSAFLAAFALFMALNIVLSLAAPFKFDPYKYVYHGWSWWTLDDLRHSRAEYNVALLGSSLMVDAAAWCDAIYLGQNLDLTKYHQMAYLSERLQRLLGGKFRTFDLSAPGQMPSDAYLMLKAMAIAGNRPDVVIYGVAPRDFIDSTLSAPSDTDTFHYVSRIINTDDVHNAEFCSFWGKLDWCLQKVVFLYDYSLDLAMTGKRLAEKAIDSYLPRPFSRNPFTWWDRVRVMPQYLPAEIHPGATIISPQAQSETGFKDNTADYRRRYRSPDQHTYLTQMYFLRKLTEYCQRERIELVLVNMPIMRLNVDLLPPGMHEKYLSELREFAWNHNLIYYDLCEFNRYVTADYHDTVHLSRSGARKFFDRLIDCLAGDARASCALSLSGLQLEKHANLAIKTQPAL